MPVFYFKKHHHYLFWPKYANVLRTMAKEESILRFDKVTFGYHENTPLMSEVDFSVRRGTKITIMGQNRAGKSTILGLIT